MSVILPGGTIGVLGGGQLGRMLAMEAHRMGYRVGVLDPKENCPAAQVADFHVQSEFTSRQCMLDFIAQVDVVTFETELVPSEFLADLAPFQSVRPSHCVLNLVQDRLIQRQYLKDHNFPQTSYGAIMNVASLRAVGERVGFPAILKKRRSGYDGKGQMRVDRVDDLSEAWRKLDEVPSVLEAVVPFKMELSIVLARGLHGEIQLYPLAENVHRQNVLHSTQVPARVDDTVRAHVEELAVSLAEALNYCGIMAVELFLLEDDTLLINEIAPRPHNSGHFTFGACTTSQFEQHIRAICGLPLGDPSLLHSVVMMNLLGDLWENGPPPWDRLLAHPHIQLHLYGKGNPHQGRKMGHFLYFGGQDNNSLYQAEDILRKLSQSNVTAPSLITGYQDKTDSGVL